MRVPSSVYSPARTAGKTPAYTDPSGSRRSRTSVCTNARLSPRRASSISTPSSCAGRVHDERADVAADVEHDRAVPARRERVLV